MNVERGANGLALLHVEALEHLLNVLPLAHGDGACLAIPLKLNSEAILQLPKIAHLKLRLEFGLEPCQPCKEASQDDQVVHIDAHHQ